MQGYRREYSRMACGSLSILARYVWDRNPTPSGEPPWAPLLLTFRLGPFGPKIKPWTLFQLLWTFWPWPHSQGHRRHMCVWKWYLKTWHISSLVCFNILHVDSHTIGVHVVWHTQVSLTSVEVMGVISSPIMTYCYYYQPIGNHMLTFYHDIWPRMTLRP